MKITNIRHRLYSITGLNQVFRAQIQNILENRGEGKAAGFEAARDKVLKSVKYHQAAHFEAVEKIFNEK